MHSPPPTPLCLSWACLRCTYTPGNAISVNLVLLILVSCCLSRGISREMHPEQYHQASVMSFDYTFDQYEPHFSLLLSPSQQLQSLPDTINTPPDRTIMRRTFQETRPNTSNCSESHYKKNRRGDRRGGWKSRGLLWTPPWGPSRNRERLVGESGAGARIQSLLLAFVTCFAVY